jgi:hypothetical protein
MAGLLAFYANTLTMKALSYNILTGGEERLPTSAAIVRRAPQGGWR